MSATTKNEPKAPSSTASGAKTDKVGNVKAILGVSYEDAKRILEEHHGDEEAVISKFLEGARFLVITEKALYLLSV
jgi:hypothetical protein